MPPFVLVGTKSDLRDNASRPVSTATADAMAKKLGAYQSRVLECSALANTGVHEVFANAVRGVIGNSKDSGGGGCCVIS